MQLKVPNAQRIEEMETAFLAQAKEFTRSLEDMNEELAAAAEKLKEQAVELFTLNNECLILDTPMLRDQIAELKSQLKELKLGMSRTDKEE